MQTRATGPVMVSALGPGGMPMSIEGRPGEARAILSGGTWAPAWPSPPGNWPGWRPPDPGSLNVIVMVAPNGDILMVIGATITKQPAHGGGLG